VKCELQLPLFFAFCDVNHPMPSHVRTLWINSVVWRADRCHCQAAEFMLHIYRIFLKKKKSSKLYIHYKIALNT
jgi:hypothetical protein